MNTRGKRARTSEAQGESSSGLSPLIVSRPPWPHPEGTKIIPRYNWEGTSKEEVFKPECYNREILEEWDKYDTLFSNAWLTMDIRPTRFMDSVAMHCMQIREDCLLAM